MFIQQEVLPSMVQAELFDWKQLFTDEELVIGNTTSIQKLVCVYINSSGEEEFFGRIREVRKQSGTPFTH
jgi:hypothetical protein